jgi:hypothetical protein
MVVVWVLWFWAYMMIWFVLWWQKEMNVSRS